MHDATALDAPVPTAWSDPVVDVDVDVDVNDDAPATDGQDAPDDAPPSASDLDALLDELLVRAGHERLADLLNDVGAVQAMRGDTVAAEVHLSSAHLLAPDNADIARNLFEVRGRLGGRIVARPVVRDAGTGWDAPQEPESPVVTTTPAAADPFAGHYYEWRRRRVAAIVERYGAAWFRGARVLELGCGYGDIGASLMTIGADVTFSEGRREHLDVIAGRYPGVAADRLVAYDAEDPWPFDERFDLVVNMGLVYHVDNWQRSVAGSIRSADRVVLETEVCDSDDPELVVKLTEAGADQALSGTGSRPSAAAVEALLRAEGCRYERLSDSRCNAGFHRYDWAVTGSGGWEHGLRRFWFVWRPGTSAPI